MALIHKASLRPTKLELLAEWLPGRNWYAGPTGDVVRVASFRFDDPAGAVGIETLLVRVADGPVHQVPLTYRQAPMADADDLLLGTAEHSVLGKRWIYDGTGDLVFAAALANAVLGNTGQAEQFTQVDGGLEPRALDMSIASSAARGAKVPGVDAIKRLVDGDPTLIVTDTVELAVIRRAGTAAATTGVVLTGTWPGQPTSLPLAFATV